MPPSITDIANRPDIPGTPTDKKANKNIWVIALWILLGGISVLWFATMQSQSARIKDLKDTIQWQKTQLAVKDSTINAMRIEYNNKVDEFANRVQQIEQAASKKGISITEKNIEQ